VETVGAPGNLWAPRFSHDNRRLVGGIGDPGDIWVWDLARRVATRLTFDPTDEGDPVWSPDDTRIFFMSQRSGGGDLYQKAAAGTGADELLYSSKNFKLPTGISPDGRWVLLNELSPKTKWDIEVFSLSDRKVVPFLQSEFDEVLGAFSPDGQWVAYASNESGRFEIYVQPFPGPGGKWQVSTSGGSSPVWRRDGKELFYLGLDHKLMSVAVKTGQVFETEAPKPLFDMRVRSDPDRLFDVSSDGQRFVVVAPVGDETAPPITLVQNWTALLRQGK
jgi:Tol biopolymer transport system component